MAIVLDNVTRPPRKLRKLLKEFPARPSPNDVHSLRTQARRLKAVVAALTPDRAKQAKRMFKAIELVRKAAGAVRDKDVMIENVIELSGHFRRGAAVRLIERLAMLREKDVLKLQDVVREQGKKACKSLKRYADWLEERSRGDRPDTTDGRVALQILKADLVHWPQLNRKNLHEFRIRAKELLYMLQFSPSTEGMEIEALDRAKENIGNWHDWVELQKVAEKVLDSTKDRAFLKQLDRITDRKLRDALVSANSLRRQANGKRTAKSRPSG